jgi:hypothetical protein
MFNKTNHPREQQESTPHRLARICRRCRAGFAALALSLVVPLLCSPDGTAQANLSTITGTVTDSTGAVIPNCTITVTSTATTAVRKVTTDGNGFYTVPALSIGSYTIVAAALGFKTSTSTVDLTLNGVTANFALTPGVTTESVTINADSGTVALETQSHDVSVSFTNQQLIDLPNTNGVSALSAAVLGPASQPGTDEPVPGDVNFFGGIHNAVNIEGLGITRTEFLQDGTANLNLLTGTANVVATAEASSGVTTILNNAPARYAEPAAINVITQGGSNQFHGLVYDYFQNNALNAVNYFATAAPALHYNLFGGDIGGPILKNKIFGFFDYSGLRSTSGVLTQARVPTLAERNGDFTADNVTIYDPLTYDPTTGSTTQFPNDTIPANRYDAFANLWLQLYPLPNYPLGSANINYVTNSPGESNSDEEISRVDWNQSDKQQITGTFFHFAQTNGTDSLVPGLFGTFVDTSGTNAMIEHTYVISPTLVNTARVGYNRGSDYETQLGVGAKNYGQFYGLNNVSPPPTIALPPAVAISNFTLLNQTAYAPDGALQNRFQYADELNWKLSRHSLAIGGQFVRDQFNPQWVLANNGLYTFTGAATAQYIGGNPNTTSSGDSFADFLLGFPANSQVGMGVTVGQFRGWNVAGYVQDDWKVASTLTLNLGLRYDFSNPPADKNGHSALYNLSLNAPIPGSWDTNYNDWGPRVGFAWSATNKLVVRGGYGIYYAPIIYNGLQYSLLWAPQFVVQTKSLAIANPVNTENQFGPSATGVSGYTIQKRLKDQSAQEWNLNIEKSLNDNTLFTIGYIGNVMRHEAAAINSNQAYAPAPGSTSGMLTVTPQPLVGVVQTQANIYSANYNALVVSLQHRYAHGFQLLANYTRSRAMDIVDGDNDDPADIYNLGLYYAPAAFDRTNNVLVSGIYDLPIGPGHRFSPSNGIISNLIGGWRLSFIQQLASGQPVSILALNLSDPSGWAEYARKVCNPTKGFVRTRFDFFNTACFVQPPVGQYGGARNAVRQPGLYPTNLSLFKGFKIFAEQQLEMRLDGFNVLNHPMFGSVTPEVITSPSLGKLTEQASGLRTVQVSLRYSF